ncbi:LexA family transcriptional regulator [Sphingobacterium spiritivorum]|uniref:DNA-binding helix-turn-helix protein n=1 Tax=Sphingobacterium spiritivorum ATCC 33861 TaxID=525373 RepID=D7VN23_SPHSI|nr:MULTISPECIES: helix-turn-helix transcriptional regulator [Sphingobacterium]EFK57320.1 DNA-binding helix-turn-helix protein [Sphingobacterium spiritivorum ATCC 33861]QQT26854.1 helix-turn-helix transcriptional regulator [Sphingobacterium spiritivorum]QQT36598.1 helix-turn-helix transcriptional regulator [Sphingobacterium spiritivorum]WQD33349.1 helix-turn-helix transcriptional regulator [Sphingobacterium spiritivorum]SUJ22632.1 Uncharacterised protein [Sphingobacterium spiritivorum]
MKNQGLYIKSILKERGITIEELANYLGMTRVTLGNRLKHEVYPSTDEKVRIIEFLKMTPSEINSLNAMGGNAFDLGSIEEDQVSELVEISPGRFRMKVELVPMYAQAGYLTDYTDTHFLEELPVHYFTTDRPAKGNYRAFETYGDSMDNGDIKEAIPSGIIVVGRELDRKYWTSKLHSHKWPNWIFVHNTEGIVVKQIADQNLETGDLTLTSLNPDKRKYPDFTINLDDVKQIYNVIKRELDY